MKVRILESVGGYLKGEIDLPHRKAIDLISKGYAVVVKEQETATDKQAENVLLSEKLRSGLEK